jgi:hypothetical protein
VMRCAIPRDLAAICLLRPPFCCTPDSLCNFPFPVGGQVEPRPF